MGYDLAARKRLGRLVRDARGQAGYTNRAEFADKVGRSARQVQALENGEDGVGPDTYAAVAKALDWPLDRIYSILEGDTEQTRTAPTSLAAVSDEELAAEVLRRMRGGERGGDTPATTEAGAALPTLNDAREERRRRLQADALPEGRAAYDEDDTPPVDDDPLDHP